MNSPPSQGTSSADLIGRSDELREIEELLTAVAAGGGTLDLRVSVKDHCLGLSGLPLVVARFGAVLAAAPAGRPLQPVPGVPGWLDDQGAEQGGDFVAGEWDLIVWWRAGVLDGGDNGQEG